MKCSNCENAEFTCVCGALVSVELSRPMPTREQIIEALRPVHGFQLAAHADAILALLNGETA